MVFEIVDSIRKGRFYALKLKKEDGRTVWVFYDSKIGQAEPLTFP